MKYTITTARDLVRVTFASSLRPVHVGTLSTEGLVALELAARMHRPPPHPGSALRGRWARGHFAGFFDQLKVEAMTELARPLGRYTEADREAILVEWAAWTGSIETFAASRDMAPSTLRRWLRGARRGRLVALDGGRR